LLDLKMEDHPIRLLAFPVCVLILAATLSPFTIKARNKWIATFLGLVWVGFTGWMFYGGTTAIGDDVLVFGLALRGISAPAAIGLIFGGSIGWYIGRKGNA